jgi:hypothetical protein
MSLALVPADRPSPIIPPTEVPTIMSKLSATGLPVRSSIRARTEAVYRPRYPPPERLSIWNGIVVS